MTKTPCLWCKKHVSKSRRDRQFNCWDVNRNKCCTDKCWNHLMCHADMEKESRYDLEAELRLKQFHESQSFFAHGDS